MWVWPKHGSSNRSAFMDLKNGRYLLDIVKSFNKHLLDSLTDWLTGVYEPCQISSMVSSLVCDNKTRQISKEFFLSMLLLALLFITVLKRSTIIGLNGCQKKLKVYLICISIVLTVGRQNGWIAQTNIMLCFYIVPPPSPVFHLCCIKATKQGEREKRVIVMRRERKK